MLLVLDQAQQPTEAVLKILPNLLDLLIACAIDMNAQTDTGCTFQRRCDHDIGHIGIVRRYHPFLGDYRDAPALLGSCQYSLRTS